MIIGLCGYAGTGKTTVADYLEKNHGFKKMNFKDGLVKEMKERLPDTLTAIAEQYGYENVDDLFKMKPAIMRALMRNYGTEVRRADYENYWVDRWRQAIQSEEGRIVTDDVRFFNELAALEDFKGILIRVTRDDVKSGGTHQSETEQTTFVPHFTIEGVEGDHKSVYEQIESILDTIESNSN